MNSITWDPHFLLVDKLDKAIILQAFRSKELNQQCNGESVNKARAFGKGPMILQAFRSKELDWQHNGELVNKARAFWKGLSIADIICYFCNKKRHTTHNCAALKAKLNREKEDWGCKSDCRANTISNELAGDSKTLVIGVVILQTYVPSRGSKEERIGIPLLAWPNIYR